MVGWPSAPILTQHDATGVVGRLRLRGAVADVVEARGFPAGIMDLGPGLSAPIEVSFCSAEAIRAQRG
jgi:hypothetical protein